MNCIPLVIVLRDYFKLYPTFTEARKDIKAKKFLVDGKEITEPRFPVGMMDIVTFKEKGENYMVVPSKTGFEFRKVEEKKAGSKYCKIINKTMTKKGLQLNLHDGRNVLLPVAEGNKFKVGDTVKVSFKTGKVEKSYAYKEGAEVVIVQGVNRGKMGKIKELINLRELKKPRAKIELDGEDKIFARDLVFVVPKSA